MFKPSRVSALLVLGGASLVAIAWSLTRPYSWSRFFLLVIAGLLLVVSSGALRRAFAGLVSQSRAQHRQAVDALQSRPLRHMLYAIWIACVVALAEIGLK